ncbi:DUF6646 family protein [Riemerella columbipharyngis]|uniref:Outer membrane protein beta-barrel domain-containing protein n=1 Tax=Riemerella columbipharyngis TaxID=1071918 RepID=A0A1G7CW61_9FLAO|nr:DUF6646 family protein [Riemerella columbipharyngis]SDE43538.1 hypothetical protein SAMN05421544_10944 [Riemerella columbipharyngis]
MKSLRNNLLVLGMLFLSQLTFSQAWKGTGDQKAQVGLSAWGYGVGLTGSYDYGISSMVSLGAGGNFYFSDNNKSNFFIFGRANFHLQDTLNLPSEWDIYPGIDLGVYNSGLGLAAHIGARYFFTDKIGAFAEIGNNGGIGAVFNF